MEGRRVRVGMGRLREKEGRAVRDGKGSLVKEGRWLVIVGCWIFVRCGRFESAGRVGMAVGRISESSCGMPRSDNISGIMSWSVGCGRSDKTGRVAGGAVAKIWESIGSVGFGISDSNPGIFVRGRPEMCRPLTERKFGSALNGRGVGRLLGT